jgi:hypothetical protein
MAKSDTEKEKKREKHKSRHSSRERSRSREKKGKLKEHKRKKDHSSSSSKSAQQECDKSNETDKVEMKASSLSRNDTPKNLEMFNLNGMNVGDLQQHIASLQFKINSQLIPKRQQLLNQMSNIRNRMNQVKKRKECIIRETKEIMDSIVMRLNTRENYKCSSLEADMMEIQNQLDDIHNYVSRLPSILEQQTNSNSDGNSHFDIKSFKDNINELILECEYLANKPFKTCLDVTCEDFEKEIYRFKIPSNEELYRIIEEKDAVIRSLKKEMEELKRLKNEEVSRLSHLYVSTKKELFEWISLIDRT